MEDRDPMVIAHGQVRNPCLDVCCSRSKDHGVSLPLLRYVVDYVFDEKMSQPAPRVLPPSFRNKPHEYLKELNSGQLPYCQNSAHLCSKLPLCSALHA